MRTSVATSEGRSFVLSATKAANAHSSRLDINFPSLSRHRAATPLRPTRRPPPCVAVAFSVFAYREGCYVGPAHRRIARRINRVILAISVNILWAPIIMLHRGQRADNVATGREEINRRLFAVTLQSRAKLIPAAQGPRLPHSGIVAGAKKYFPCGHAITDRWATVFLED